MPVVKEKFAFLGGTASRAIPLMDDQFKKDIAEGLAALERATRLRRPGEYQLQAAITALHIEGSDAGTTDWEKIADALLEYESLSGDDIKHLLAGKPPSRANPAEPSTPRGSAVPPAGKPRSRPDTGGLEPQPQA